MSYLQTESIRTEWVQQVRANLQTWGYYYEPDFCTEIADAESIITAARLLGYLYDPNEPVILTQPSPKATQNRVFDRGAGIGWHNDFSSRAGRPEVSLSLIRQGDPSGVYGGAWRVASTTEVLSKLSQTRKGKQLISELVKHAEPFGYRDKGGWQPFRVIIGANSRLSRLGLRFYKRPLEEGAWLRFGQIPERTRDMITRIEEAADAVGETLPATTGALLIVDNRLSLHDRIVQQVTGPKEQRRQAWLCFVKKLYQPL